MRPNNVIRKVILTLIVVLFLYSIGIGNITVSGPDGPNAITGRVYTSEGENLGDGFEGTYAALIIEHEQINSTFFDHNGLELDDEGSYWYGVTLPSGAWDAGDTFWIVVNGTGWGDLNYTCTDHDYPSVGSWEMSSSPEVLHVNTVNNTVISDGSNGSNGDGGTTTSDDDNGGDDTLFLMVLIWILVIIVIILTLLVILLIKQKKKQT